MNNKISIQQELEQIATANDGLLRPVDVVDYAKNEETALHKRFTWDDSRAAQLYRLEQARHIIRSYVTVIGEPQKEVRLYVSMLDDRPENGYRFTTDVMSEPERRGQLLRQAKNDFAVWENKYRTLVELVPVFEAMNNLGDDVMVIPQRVSVVEV